jgi:hypothetical protein
MNLLETIFQFTKEQKEAKSLYFQIFIFLYKWWLDDLKLFSMALINMYHIFQIKFHQTFFLNVFKTHSESFFTLFFSSQPYDKILTH